MIQLSPLMLSKDPSVQRVFVESHEQLCRLMKEGFAVSSNRNKPTDNLNVGFYHAGGFHFGFWRDGLPHRTVDLKTYLDFHSPVSWSPRRLYIRRWK